MIACEEIYVLKAGLRYGPYSALELQECLDTGAFTNADFLSCDGGWMRMSEWTGLESEVFAVECDEARNLLTIRYRDRVGAAAVERCCEHVRSALQKLESGFRLLVDLTELESMELESVPHIKKIMSLCAENDVSAVVRIVPDPTRDIGLQILSFFHYGPHVLIATCASAEEAEAQLD